MFGFGSPTKGGKKASTALDDDPVLVTMDDVPGATARAAHEKKGEATLVMRTTEEDSTPIFSGICLLVYIGVWMASLSSPFILLGLFLLGHRVLLTLVVGIMGAAYLPDEFLPQWDGMRKFFAHHNPRYFKSTSLRLEAPLDPEKPTMVCVHPHGIFCLGWGQLALQDVVQHVRFCFSNALYMSPFFRLFTRLLCWPAGVDKATLRRLMAQKQSLALIPGGFEDATLHTPKVDRVFLKKRKGFVKYALEYGYSLTPVLSLGERESFDNLEGHYDLRFKLNAQGMPAVTPIGLPFFPLLPKRCGIHIVVGTPLELPHIEKPSAEDVDKHHELYMDHLFAFYNRHKVIAYGEGAPDLEIW